MGNTGLPAGRQSATEVLGRGRGKGEEAASVRATEKKRIHRNRSAQNKAVKGGRVCNDARAPGWRTRQMAGPSSRRDRKMGPTFLS